MDCLTGCLMDCVRDEEDVRIYNYDYFIHKLVLSFHIEK